VVKTYFTAIYRINNFVLQSNPERRDEYLFLIFRIFF